MWDVWRVKGPPKCLSNGERFGVRRRGRPRKRWLQDVKDDLRRMRIGKWKEKAGTKYMAANCEGSQSPARAVELRKKKKCQWEFCVQHYGV
jgi:hypothetical protein